MPDVRERLSHAPEAGAAVVFLCAGRNVGVEVVEGVAGPVCPGRTHLVGFRLGLSGASRGIVTADFHGKAALVSAAVLRADDVPPGQVLVMAPVEILVGMGEFAFTRPGVMNGRVHVQQAVRRREAEQHPHEGLAHGGGLEAVVRVAPGVHAVAAAGEHRAPAVAGVVLAAEISAVKAQRAQPRLEPAGIQARLSRRDGNPVFFRKRDP